MQFIYYITLRVEKDKYINKPKLGKMIFSLFVFLFYFFFFFFFWGGGGGGGGGGEGA